MAQQPSLQGFDFRNTPQLQRFVLQNIRPTGRRIGDGSYGTVEELDMQGLICAGKKLHAILVERGNMGDGTASILGRFVEECSLLSGLRHPNIVQFLGICFLETSDIPVLVMEFLPYCLDSLLNPGEGAARVEIPLGIKYDILSDTTHGLVHLHTQTPPIIHRDLTAKNILLTSTMMGKVADLGVARILNVRPGRLAATMTTAPGTLSYMPPEVLAENPVYNTSIDMFSFGHLILYTITQDFPYPTEPTLPDPHNTGMIIGVREVQRRSRQMQELSRVLGGEGHSLVQLVRQCLHNDPRQRPSARQVLDRLQQMRAQIDDPYGNMSKLELIQALRRREGGGREAALQAQFTQLQGQLQAQEEASRAEIQQIQAELQTSQTEIQQVQAQFRTSQSETQQVRSRLEQVQAQLRAKETELQRSQSRTHHVEAQWRADTQRAEGELRVREQEIQELRDQLRRREATITELTRTTSQAQAHHPPLSFNWRRGRDMLFGTNAASAVALNGKLYMGGGGAENQYTIQVYTAESDGWSRLPECAVRRFAMAVLNQQLVVVGGRSRNYQDQATVLVWDTASQCWITPYPKMPTARCTSAALGYQQYLIVAGGKGRSPLTTVEVFNTTDKRWATAAPLPVRCYCLTRALVGETLYLLGGLDASHSHNKQMLSVSVPALLSHATTTPQTPPPTWEVTDTELAWSTAVSVHNSLLAVGGEVASNTRSSAIHLYDSQTRQWTKAGDILAAVSHCSCAVLSSGELAVLGGLGEGGRRSVKVHIARVN